MAQTLIVANKPLRVVVRKPERLSDEIRSRAQIVTGSTDDPEVLSAALDGADALFLCIPPGWGTGSLLNHYTRFAQAAADTIAKTGTRRVVFVSGGGYGCEYGGMYTVLHTVERILNESGANTRHLRCGCFMENFLDEVPRIFKHGELAWPLPPDLAFPVVATRDIAGVAVRLLLDCSWTGQGFQAVHGPADLTPSEIAETLGEAVGSPTTYRELIGEEVYHEMLGDDLLGMFRMIRNGWYKAEPRDATSTTTTTLAQWARSTPFMSMISAAAADLNR